MKDCLVVLGMHRSGTSAFTGILNQYGVQLGDSLMEGKPDNPKGFFENTFVVDTNEALLASLQSSWHDPLALPSGWQEQLDDARANTDIRRFLSREIQQGQLYALKDPRLSLLLPYWLPLFAAESITPHFAILVRHPLEIAESLDERNGFSRELSLLLWLRYMLAAERHTRQHPRTFIHFDTLLEAPETTATDFFQRVGLDWPGAAELRPGHLAGFLEADMRHHSRSAADLEQGVPALVRDCYRLLSRAADSGALHPEGESSMDQLADTLASQQEFLQPGELARAARERGALPLSLDEFLHSPAWRLYRGYQLLVERLFPEGTALRSGLKRAKRALLRV